MLCLSSLQAYSGLFGKSWKMNVVNGSLLIRFDNIGLDQFRHLLPINLVLLKNCRKSNSKTKQRMRPIDEDEQSLYVKSAFIHKYMGATK